MGNHNTSVSSTIVITLGLLQALGYNVIREIKYSEEKQN